MRPGWLNKRVTIEQKSVTRAANGEEIVAWVPHATPVWASILPLRGREFFAAAQMQGAADIKVTIRYRPTVARDMRIVHQTPVMDIVAEPINVKSMNEWTELMCVTGVRNG